MRINWASTSEIGKVTNNCKVAQGSPKDLTGVTGAWHEIMESARSPQKKEALGHKKKTHQLILEQLQLAQVLLVRCVQRSHHHVQRKMVHVRGLQLSQNNRNKVH